MKATIEPATDGLVVFDLLERGAPAQPYAESLIPALPRRVAAGCTCSELTEHARTNFKVIEAFLPVRHGDDHARLSPPIPSRCAGT